MTERGILIAGGYGVVGQRISAELAPDYQVIVAGRHLERPNAIETSLLLSARDATGPASFDYFLKELTMPFEVHVDGADRPAHAFSDPRVIEFPSPFGPRSAYLFPFSDQVLYPRTMDAQTALTRLAMEPARRQRCLRRRSTSARCAS